MSRTLLLAAALTASTALTSVSTLAQAQGTLYRWKWEGAVRIVQETEACGGVYVSDDNSPAIYQPNIDEVDDRRSSLTIFRKSSTVMIQSSSHPDQFHGLGYYDRFTIVDGAIKESFADEGFQSFDFVQTPEVVNDKTPFITLSGKLNDYGVDEDCTVTLRGSFVAVDSTEPPPPPPYGD